MVASIGAIASPSQGVSYYERDGYYAKDSAEHRDACTWAGKGADDLGLKGPVDPGVFTSILVGRVPDGPQLGRRGKDGDFVHRPGRDLTLSAPKSVSLAALVGGNARVADAHGRAVKRTLAWVERNAVETRMKDPDGERMIRAGDHKAVIATFTHETSRNLEPQLHTHVVIANMVQGEDGKWRSMANEKLYSSKMLIGALYRGELARELTSLGYGIEKTHADGRFEIAGVSRDVIESFSTRRAEIEAAMEGRGLGSTAENQHLARRAALMTRAHKRDVDKEALREAWVKQAASLGFDAKDVDAAAIERGLHGPDRNGSGRRNRARTDRIRWPSIRPDQVSELREETRPLTVGAARIEEIAALYAIGAALYAIEKEACGQPTERRAASRRAQARCRMRWTICASISNQRGRVSCPRIARIFRFPVPA